MSKKKGKKISSTFSTLFIHLSVTLFSASLFPYKHYTYQEKHVQIFQCFVFFFYLFIKSSFKISFT